MQMRVDQHGKFDVRECDGQEGPATGQSEPEYTKCNALCGQGTRLRLIYDYDSNNIEATVETCFMPPCPGDAPTVCPAGATPITTQAPITAVPVSRTDTNTPGNPVNNGNTGNSANDVTIGVVTDDTNAATPTPTPVTEPADNGNANTNNNNTGDTNNNNVNTNPVTNPVTSAATSATSANNQVDVDSKSTPAVNVPGTAGPNTTDGTASLTITLYLLLGIIINLH